MQEGARSWVSGDRIGSGISPAKSNVFLRGVRNNGDLFGVVRQEKVHFRSKVGLIAQKIRRVMLSGHDLRGPHGVVVRSGEGLEAMA